MCLYAKYLANVTQVSDVAPEPLVFLTGWTFNWNFIYSFILDNYRSSFSFYTFDLFLTELCPLINCENQFSGLFPSVHLKFDIWLYLIELQIKILFDYVWSTFDPLMIIISFLSCFCSSLRYKSEILYMALSWIVVDEGWVRYIGQFFDWIMVLDKLQKLVFQTFFRNEWRYSTEIWYMTYLGKLQMKFEFCHTDRLWSELYTLIDLQELHFHFGYDQHL
jgi:hypothetical protein